MIPEVTGNNYFYPELISDATLKQKDAAEKEGTSLFAALVQENLNEQNDAGAEKTGNNAPPDKSGNGKTERRTEQKTEQKKEPEKAGKQPETNLSEKKTEKKDGDEKTAGLAASFLNSGKEKKIKKNPEGRDNGNMGDSEAGGKLLKKSGQSTQKENLELLKNFTAENPDVKAVRTERKSPAKESAEQKMLINLSGKNTGRISVPLKTAETEAKNGPDKSRGVSEGKTRHLVLDLRKNAKGSERHTDGNSQRGNSSSNDGNMNAKGSNFQSAVQLKEAENFDKLSTVKQKEVLQAHLKQELNSEIVKQTRFIINSETSGEIRLTLKPENLGSVRIKINLEDNHIAGKILVENNTVKEVFEQNMKNLQQAFRENGFESARMDVSVGNNNRGGDQKNSSGRNSAAEAGETRISAANRRVTLDLFRGENLIDLTA